MARRRQRGERRERRHFSMIRSFALADLVTLANGFAGTGAVLATMRHQVDRDPAYLWAAFALLPVALVFDAADGRIARWRQRASPLGQELDSLADVISFGVAPACLGFALGLDGGWDVPVLLYFVGCGISRLARFNITAASLADDTGKVRTFEGTPIPTSLAIVGLLAWLAWTGRTGERLPLGGFALGPLRFHPLVLLYAASGSAMISKTLKIPKP